MINAISTIYEKPLSEYHNIDLTNENSVDFSENIDSYVESERLLHESLFIVEGKDDVFFLSKLFRDISLDKKTHRIFATGGRPNIPLALQTAIKSPKFSSNKYYSISLICDYDENVDEFNKFQKNLDKILSDFSGEQVLTSLGEYVQFRRHEMPSISVRIGLFALPNSNDTGDLERLGLETVKADGLNDDAAALLKKACDQLEQLGKHNALNGSSYKRVAQIFLACSAKELCSAAGMAFYKDYFKINNPALDPIRRFVQRARQ